MNESQYYVLSTVKTLNLIELYYKIEFLWQFAKNL